jgi:hypothetical protein
LENNKNIEIEIERMRDENIERDVKICKEWVYIYRILFGGIKI